MKGLMSVIVRFYYSIKGKIILKGIVRQAIVNGDTELPKKYFYLDNLEDGFDGNKRGWYDNYLGITAKSLSIEEQVNHAYKWCASRNPCWNTRYHPRASIGVKPSDIEWKGSTWRHEYQKGFQWYRCTTHGKYKSTFLLIPVTSNRSLYLRFGWKIYPEFGMENKKLWPYKDRSVWTVSIRIKG